VRACDLLLARFDINSAMMVLPSASGCLDAILPGSKYRIPGSIIHGGHHSPDYRMLADNEISERLDMTSSGKSHLLYKTVNYVWLWYIYKNNY